MSKRDERWRIAQGHMSGHLAGNEPDPGESLRKAAGEVRRLPHGPAHGAIARRTGEERRA